MGAGRALAGPEAAGLRAGVAAALNAAPDNAVVANQALTHGVSAGDWPLALRAARTAEYPQKGDIPSHLFPTSISAHAMGLRRFLVDRLGD